MAALMAIGLGLLASPGLAQDMPRQISVTGEGQVEAVPDMALISVGVEADDPGARAAMDRAAAGAQAVLAALAAAGIEARDIQTGQVMLNPVWDHRTDPDAAPRVTGFRAVISMNLRLRDLDKLGPVLDAVVGDGANRLGGLSFAVADPDPLMAQARALAVRDAMARARQMADAAGVTLGEVLSISEHGGGARPMMMGMAEARASDIPVAAGEVSLSANVSMVFAIAE
ncbi:MAG: DUF541 domain-containing protein [Rhodobacteraceae bacterium]|nr:MAG: DUF541 domain-containing protein [Paracoccaceae bacterium]